MDIGPAVGLCVHYVQACPGTSVCKFGVRDSLGLGLELEEMFVGAELPAKLKVGVSGCPMCCAESYARDVGLIGKPKGWTWWSAAMPRASRASPTRWPGI